MLCAQQTEMFRNNTHQVPDRIVSLHKPWVGSIVRGKQNADVEFGAKVKMSVVNGFLRVEDLFWDALNDGNTLQASVESFRPAYGYDPKRILTDTFFRICENLCYCKKHHIHLNGPRLGEPSAHPAPFREQGKQEWLESGERGEIELDFGVGKSRYSLSCIVTKLRHTSEVAVSVVVLTMNL